MAITSQVRTPLGFGETMVADWQGAGLIKPSLLKPVFTTIEQGLVLRSMGTLSEADLRSLRQILAQVFSCFPLKHPSDLLMSNSGVQDSA